MSLCLEKIASWLDISCPENIKITGVSIDTRTLVPGNLFVALKGSRVDGHAFIPDAIKQGAAAILCTAPQANLSIPVLLYPDLEKALILMATAYRKTLTSRVAALTGSNGKTSVKTMLKAILGDKAFATPGNWNNHLGVPLSVLQVNASHQYAVFELGANHIGEIATTVAIVVPEVVCVNNIGPAHIGEFGSMDAIATAKGEIYAGLPATGTAVVNADDAYAHFWDDLLQEKQVLRFSAHLQDVDIFARAIDLAHPEGTAFQIVSGDESCEVVLKVRGMHHVHNALAAASMAKVLGLDLAEIAKGLSAFEGVSGRLMPKKTSTGALILDDTYNANLNSVLTGIEVLAGYSGKRVLVFGDMGELGEYSHAHHEAVGIAAKKHGINCLLTCGTASEAAAKAFGAYAIHFEAQAGLLDALKPLLDSETTVLIKGSRASAMDKVVQGLFEPSLLDSNCR